MQLKAFWDRQVIALLLSSGLIGVAGAFVVTTLSLFLFRELAVSALWIGAFFAVCAVSEIFSDLVLGYLSDGKTKRITILTVCTLFSAIGALFLVFSRDYWVLMAGCVVFFGLGGAIFPQIFALTRDVADHKGLSSNQFNAYIRSVTSAAWVLAPPIAFVMIDLWGFALLYTLAAIFYGLAAVVFLVGRFRGTVDLEEENSFRFSALSPRVFSLVILVLCLLTVNMVYQINVALFVTEELGLAATQVGFILGLGSALEIPLIILFGHLVTRVGASSLLLLCAGSAVLFFLCLPHATHFTALLLVQIPNAIWVSIVLSLPIVLLQDLLKNFHGMASSIYSSAFKFGAFAGGAVGGALVTWLGFQNTFYLCALVSLIGGLAILATWRAGESIHAV